MDLESLLDAYAKAGSPIARKDGGLMFFDQACFWETDGSPQDDEKAQFVVLLVNAFPEMVEEIRSLRSQNADLAQDLCEERKQYVLCRDHNDELTEEVELLRRIVDLLEVEGGHGQTIHRLIESWRSRNGGTRTDG